MTRHTSTTMSIILMASLASLAGGCEFVDGEFDGDEIGQSQKEIVVWNNKAIWRFHEADLIQYSTYRNELIDDGLYYSRYDLKYALDEYNSRYFLKAAVECALTGDQAVWFRYYKSGSYYWVKYVGDAGFAPEWKYNACDTECQQKVTGCMLSRVNYKGIEVPLSLRTYDSTPTPSLERFEHHLAEGAFYGNFFVSGSSKPLYFCSAMTTEHEPELRWNRWCGTDLEDERCDGITYTGPCNDFYSSRRACYYETSETSGINGDGTGYYPSGYLYCMDGDYKTKNPEPVDYVWYKWPVSPHRHYTNGN